MAQVLLIVFFINGLGQIDNHVYEFPSYLSCERNLVAVHNAMVELEIEVLGIRCLHRADA